MATATVDVGTGTTITFGTSSSFTPKIRSVKITGPEVPVIDTTNLSTTGTRTAMFGDLKSNTMMEIEYDYNPSLTFPVGVTETVTLTCPIPAGGTNGATISGSGGLQNYDATIPLEDKMTGTLKIQYLGTITYTSAS
ncbi:MAG: hypothetical protein EBR82_27905 [Caulobacteraceae bacterium]|nr:hypothetical protein [Caulobacteraceae bacterium]